VLRKSISQLHKNLRKLQMKLNNLKGSLILITAAFIWGMAFVAQSSAADSVPPFIINALRSFIAAIVLYLFNLAINHKETIHFFPEEKNSKKKFYIAGLICGICLTISANLQQFGIAAYPDGAASEARSAFLTALYVILVPIFSLFAKKKLTLPVWIGIAVALVGIYMLCFSGGINGIYLGDILVFCCAISFALHIMAVDKYVGITGGIKLSIMQFTVVGILSLILSFIFEFKDINMSNIISAACPILYLGIMSSGVAYTLQIVGQKYAEPAVASISMSLESVFGALGGCLMGKALATREIIGCALVFVAIIVAQIQPSNKKSIQ